MKQRPKKKGKKEKKRGDCFEIDFEVPQLELDESDPEFEPALDDSIPGSRKKRKGKKGAIGK